MSTLTGQEKITEVAEKEAAELLKRLGIYNPPVDTFTIAKNLGLLIQTDPLLKTRGYSRKRWDLGFIILGSKSPDKSARNQFTIAHEIGEMLLDGKVDEAYREKACNLIALNLLLPKEWFKRDAESYDFDLFTLKKIYSTASHEIIAFRMLEFRPMIITIFDNGQLYRRKSSYPFRVKNAYSLEEQCLKVVANMAKKTHLQNENINVTGWPIFKKDWKRLILKTEFNRVHPH